MLTIQLNIKYLKHQFKENTFSNSFIKMGLASEERDLYFSFAL